MSSFLGSQLDRTVAFWSKPAWWAYLVVTPWVLGLVFAFWLAHALHEAGARQAITTGRIDAHNPADHDGFAYTFTVHGRQYRSWDYGAVRPLQLGQQVAVYFDSAAPATSGLTTFSAQREHALAPVPFLGASLLTVLGLIFWQRRSARRAARNDSTGAVHA